MPLKLVSQSYISIAYLNMDWLGCLKLNSDFTGGRRSLTATPDMRKSSVSTQAVIAHITQHAPHNHSQTERDIENQIQMNMKLHSWTTDMYT